MARVFDGDNNVTTVWDRVSPVVTMPRLLEVLNQWHEAHRQQFVRDGYTNSLPSFDEREEKHAHVGAKYIRLDVGTSGAWMLEASTGDIFNIKGYGQVNKAKCAGNINDPDFHGAVLFCNRFLHGRFDLRKAASR